MRKNDSNHLIIFARAARCLSISFCFVSVAACVVNPSLLPRMIGRIASTALEIWSDSSIGGESSGPKVVEEWYRVIPFIVFANVVCFAVIGVEGRIVRALVTTIETVEIIVLPFSTEDKAGRWTEEWLGASTKVASEILNDKELEGIFSSPVGEDSLKGREDILGDSLETKEPLRDCSDV